MDSFDVVRAVSYLKKQLEGKNLESINTGAEIIQMFSSIHPPDGQSQKGTRHLHGWKIS